MPDQQVTIATVRIWQTVSLYAVSSEEEITIVRQKGRHFYQQAITSRLPRRRSVAYYRLRQIPDPQQVTPVHL